jgi:hypothetical protein
MLAALITTLFTSLAVKEALSQVITSLTVTKTGTPTVQSAPGTITWNVTVTNTGDVTLTGVNVTDSRHGALGGFGALTPGATGFFTIVESDLPSGTYTDQAFAAGWYDPENLTVIGFSDLAECIVTPPNACISLTKTPSATCVLNGTAVSYLYNATNTGLTALTGAIIDNVFGRLGTLLICSLVVGLPSTFLM